VELTAKRLFPTAIECYEFENERYNPNLTQVFTPKTGLVSTQMFVSP